MKNLSEIACFYRYLENYKVVKPILEIEPLF